MRLPSQEVVGQWTGPATGEAPVLIYSGDSAWVFSWGSARMFWTEQHGWSKPLERLPITAPWARLSAGFAVEPFHRSPTSSLPVVETFLDQAEPTRTITTDESLSIGSDVVLTDSEAGIGLYSALDGEQVGEFTCGPEGRGSMKVMMGNRDYLIAEESGWFSFYDVRTRSWHSLRAIYVPVRRGMPYYAGPRICATVVATPRGLSWLVLEAGSPPTLVPFLNEGDKFLIHRFLEGPTGLYLARWRYDQSGQVPIYYYEFGSDRVQFLSQVPKPDSPEGIAIAKGTAFISADGELVQVALPAH